MSRLVNFIPLHKIKIMKRTLILSAFPLLFILLFFAPVTMAQMTGQSISIQPGYTNQSFYSLSNGELVNTSNTNWDIAFQLRGMKASILINSKNNVRLWKANKSISQWSSMTVADTTGILSNPVYELFNSDTSWDFGAFNRTNDASNVFDLGWGVYDFISHAVTGDSVFFIKIGASDFRKIQIESLIGGTYSFRWANLDGSNEISTTLSKANYAGKYFVYFSMVNNVAIDREPLFNTWDLTFCQYQAIFPVSYKVVGVLSNDSVLMAKAYPVDVNTASASGLAFEEEINTIGYDWKSFDLGTNSWIIADSLVYFVADRQGNIWKMIFTGFGGASTGVYNFEKGPAATTGLLENSSIRTFGIYPNPARDHARLILDNPLSGDAQLMLIDQSGRVTRSEEIRLSSGLQSIDLSLEGCKPGLYQVVIQSGPDRQISRLMVH